MAFKRLSTKLAVMYGGLFSAALLVIALACYMAVISYARVSVQKELQANAEVFKRIWTLNSEALQTNAGLLSRDFGFKQALATNDKATVESAFLNLQGRLNADAGVILGADGQPVAGDHSALSQTVTSALAGRDAWQPVSGIVAVDNRPWQAVAAPVMAPDRLGWVIFASRLDEAEMRGMETLSAIPIRAVVMTQTRGGLWQGPQEQTRDFKTDSLSFVIDQSLQTKAASMVDSAKGSLIAVATPLPSLDGRQTSVLLLTYPLGHALKAYQPLLTVLLGIGTLGLILVVVASLYLSRSLVRPILALKDAAFNL